MVTIINAMNEITIQNKIERYISGNLAEKEIDDLWVEFIKDPELYEYFETYLHLKYMAKNPFLSSN